MSFDDPQLAAIYAANRAKGFAEGVVEGTVASVLLILDTRSIPLTAEIRARIEACRDLAMLQRWVFRVATLSSAEEIFASRA